MKILIVDDDIDILRSLEKMLVDHGHGVDSSDNAETAVAMAEKEHYDFVLVDYKMPNKDGSWFVKNAELPPTTKILLVTAYADKKIIRKMFKLGVSGYVIKPFDAEELLRHLAYHSI